LMVGIVCNVPKRWNWTKETSPPQKRKSPPV
jgi:hypothetical protein